MEVAAVRALILGLALFPSAAWAATGSVDVKVSNAPGEIVLDGIPTGLKAPAVLSDVPVGSHQLELEYGCMVGSATVDVVEGQATVIDLPLQNVGGTGMLRLKNLPGGAEVVVDGALVTRPEEGVTLRGGALGPLLGADALQLGQGGDVGGPGGLGGGPGGDALGLGLSLGQDRAGR